MSGFLPGSVSSTAAARNPSGSAAGRLGAAWAVPHVDEPAPSATAPVAAFASRRRRVIIMFLPTFLVLRTIYADISRFCNISVLCLQQSGGDSYSVGNQICRSACDDVVRTSTVVRIESREDNMKT